MAQVLTQPARGLRLSISLGDGQPRALSVAQFPAAIGRDPEHPVALTGLWVGRCHAVLKHVEAGFFLVDQGMLSGTIVNGQRIAEYGPLKKGDTIQIGSWQIVVADLMGNLAEAVSDDDLLLERALARLREALDLRRKDWQGISDDVVRAECRSLLEPLLPELMPHETSERRESIAGRVLSEAVGLGPLEALFQDPDISEVMINRFDQIFVERHGRCEQVAMRFSGEDSVRAVIDRIVSPLGRRIDDASPMVDARLADGSRVNAVIRPLAIQGPCMTIRRFGTVQWGPRDLIAKGSLTEPMLRFLELAVTHRTNVVVSGGTGSGKTTLLNLLSQWIPAHERVITIEDAAELRLDHQNLVSLEVRHANAEGRGQVSIRDLLRNSLRMRPDRIIVGECRGGEALDMLQAMNTGHEGSLTTIHANNTRDALGRLEVMVLMAGFDLPIAAIREQIASAVDIIIQQQRCSDGRRRVTCISEVTGIESGVIQTQDIFTWNEKRQTFSASGVIPLLVDRLRQAGISVDLDMILDSSEFIE